MSYSQLPDLPAISLLQEMRGDSHPLRSRGLEAQLSHSPWKMGQGKVPFSGGKAVAY